MLPCVGGVASSAAMLGWHGCMSDCAGLWGGGRLSDMPNMTVGSFRTGTRPFGQSAPSGQAARLAATFTSAEFPLRECCRCRGGRPIAGALPSGRASAKGPEPECRPVSHAMRGACPAAQRLAAGALARGPCHPQLLRSTPAGG
eukprot:359108-Chlamydomonas_euryale.AAC.18